MEVLGAFITGFLLTPSPIDSFAEELGLRTTPLIIHPKPPESNSPQPQPRLEIPRWPAYGLPKDKSNITMPRLLSGSADLSPMCGGQEDLGTFIPECTLSSAEDSLRDQSCRLPLGSGSPHPQDSSLQPPRKFYPSSAHYGLTVCSKDSLCAVKTHLAKRVQADTIVDKEASDLLDQLGLPQSHTHSHAALGLLWEGREEAQVLSGGGSEGKACVHTHHSPD